jgi:hypothetical protein
MRHAIAVGLLTLIVVLPSRAADEDNWSSVKGKVVFDDSKLKIPQRVMPPGAKGANLPPCAAMDKDFLTEDWIVDPKTKAVKNVIVWLVPEPTAAEWKRLKSTGTDRLREFPSFKPAQIHPDLRKPAAKTHTIDQPCCRFIPHVLLAREGDNLDIKNSASFAHNAKWDSDKNGAFNESIKSDGGVFAVKGLKAERYPIKMQCFIHGWMFALVKVFDHPYFALTDEKGKFEIPKVPVGDLRIFVWHEEGVFTAMKEDRFGEPLTVKPKVTETRTFEVKIPETKK